MSSWDVAACHGTSTSTGGAPMPPPAPADAGTADSAATNPWNTTSFDPAPPAEAQAQPERLSAVAGAFGGIGNFLGDVAGGIASAVGGAADAVGSAAGDVVDTLSGRSNDRQWMIGALRAMGNPIVGVLLPVLDWFDDLTRMQGPRRDRVNGLLNQLWNDIFDALNPLPGGGWDQVGATLQKLNNERTLDFFLLSARNTPGFEARFPRVLDALENYVIEGVANLPADAMFDDHSTPPKIYVRQELLSKLESFMDGYQGHELRARIAAGDFTFEQRQEILRALGLAGAHEARHMRDHENGTEERNEQAFGQFVAEQAELVASDPSRKGDAEAALWTRYVELFELETYVEQEDFMYRSGYQLPSGKRWLTRAADGSRLSDADAVANIVRFMQEKTREAGLGPLPFLQDDPAVAGGWEVELLSPGWRSPGWRSPGWRSPGWRSPGWRSP